MNQNYWNLLFSCVSDTLHRSGPQITLIVIHSHQMIGMIHHIAIPHDIAFSAVLRSDHHTLRTHLPEKVHPALAPLIPLGIVALEGQHHHQLYTKIEAGNSLPA